MYLWIGCKLPEDFSRNIRSRCLALSNSSVLDFTGFTLPQHISLKISFDTGEEYEKILNDLSSLLHRHNSFSVQPMTIAGHRTILWICFRENEHLRQLHNTLDAHLEREFRIPQHPFDKEFLFHSTLCMGEEVPISEAAKEFADYPLPGELIIDTFLLGISETGKSGSYRVVRQIHL